MEIEEAIQKAIEGGYEFEGMRIDPNDGERYIPSEF
jgi:hypothetical protein